MFAILLSLSGCDLDEDSDFVTTEEQFRGNLLNAQILSAYFGADDGAGAALALIANCPLNTSIGVQDGMPLVLNVEIDQDTLDPDDFEVTFLDQDGVSTTASPVCVGLPPAGDEPEDRTILMVGQFGDGADVQQVAVVGNLHAEGGGPLQGLTFNQVTAFGVGPAMVYAEVLSPDEWAPLDAQPMNGNECAQGTEQIVQVSWQGGINNASNTAEVNDVERQEYVVTVDTPEGLVDVAPFDLGDLNDRDNVHDLCLDITGTPVQVYMPSNIVSAPGGFTNPETTVDILP